VFTFCSSSGHLPNDWSYYQGEVVNSQPNSHELHRQNGSEVAINFKPLPFYEKLSEILMPTRLCKIFLMILIQKMCFIVLCHLIYKLSLV